MKVSTSIRSTCFNVAVGLGQVVLALSQLSWVQVQEPGSAECSCPHAIDQDGVVKLYPDAPGLALGVGGENLAEAAHLSIDNDVQPVRQTDGALEYWTLPAYAFDYASGGEGRTARLHISASGLVQQSTWETQPKYLSGPLDLGDQEFTAYVRVRGIHEARRAAIALKIRGGEHTANDPALASCTMMTFASREAPGGVSRFGKELDHPSYDYVPLPLCFDTSLREGQWVGLKLVSFRDPKDVTQVVNRLYVDDAPFTSDGKPSNDFRLLSEYIDRAGQSTGKYDTLVDWGGVSSTLRVDGVNELDVAILSARAIRAGTERAPAE